MSNTLFSPSWYRVAALKPRLRAHVDIHRHEYRGKIWYILQDLAGTRSHRFSPAAYRFIGLMNGHLSVAQIWEALNASEEDEAPTQDEVIGLLGQLHAADALICDVPPDAQELFRRHQRQQRMRLRQRLWTPLALRFPLFDPENFLVKTLPYARFFFNRYAALVWLVLVTTGVVLAAMHWSELTENIVDRTLAPQNLLVLWLVYPFVKALHEFAHGYTAKLAGGEVHEMGIMLLVLIPVPYIDVSSTWGVRDKYKRMLIGAAGIATELLLAALALIVWLNVETGIVHMLAYNVMLISGVSTVLFNGNPLLRFDGYYVLADWLEIPNLGTRANNYLGYLIKRYIFSSKDAQSPADSSGERIWFVVYGIAAFLYRMFILFAIIIYIGTKFFTLGVLLALWAGVTQLLVPIFKGLNAVVAGPQLRGKRVRSVSLTFGFIGLFLLFIVAFPFPSWTLTQGVTWVSERSQLRATGNGFVIEQLIPVGSRVREGDVLFRAEDEFLSARLELLEAQKTANLRQLRLAQTLDRVQVALLREEQKGVEAELERVREKLADLQFISPRDGILIVPESDSLPGLFVKKGRLLGYVIEHSDDVIVKALVPQDRIQLAREHTRRVDVIAAEWEADSYQATILREVPGGTDQLPSVALGSMGGGPFAINPMDSSGRTAMTRAFEFELGLPDTVPTEFLGRRVYVRFDHGYEPLGFQVYRSLRQLFLRRFGV